MRKRSCELERQRPWSVVVMVNRAAALARIYIYIYICRYILGGAVPAGRCDTAAASVAVFVTDPVGQRPASRRRLGPAPKPCRPEARHGVRCGADRDSPGGRRCLPPHSHGAPRGWLPCIRIWCGVDPVAAVAPAPPRPVDASRPSHARVSV
jgi:hypothetical protein